MCSSLLGCIARPSLVAACISLSALTTASAADQRQAFTPSVSSRPAAGEMLLNRYTSVSLSPAEDDYNPLAVVAKVTFPRAKVQTVGDAVRYLLIRTGYELPPLETLDPQVVRIFQKRLPDSHREMGPYKVDAMLQVLMGQPFRVQVDHVSREISYLPRVPAQQVTAAPNAPKKISKLAKSAAAAAN